MKAIVVTDQAARTAGTKLNERPAGRGIRFRPNDSDPWTEYDGVIIPSGEPHAMDGTTVEANPAIQSVLPRNPSNNAVPACRA